MTSDTYPNGREKESWHSNEPLIKCQCGKRLTWEDPCPIPSGTMCPLLPTRK